MRRHNVTSHWVSTARQGAKKQPPNRELFLFCVIFFRISGRQGLPRLALSVQTFIHFTTVTRFTLTPVAVAMRTM